jgi:cardiolipin synthase
MIKNTEALQQIIFPTARDFFPSLIAAINAAEKTIDLETYIFSLDSLWEKVANALINAANRGVKVRVLVDGAGTSYWGGSFTKKLEQAGVETRIFHPFPWRLWQWSRSYVRVNFLLKAIYLLLKINSRNHRKLCIIDNTVAFAGSFNISKVHLDTNEGGSDWRDTAVKITGENLKELCEAFNTAWDHLPIQERIQEIFRPVERDPVIRLNNTRHLRRSLYKNLLNKISHCKKRLWMVNAYFIPDNILLRKLKEVAESGIDVRIILPKKSDIFFMPWASAAFYQSLLKSGVKIYEYLPSMLHTKMIIIDDWITVGSSNLNHRSLLHDLEIDVNIRTPEAKTAVENQFAEDLQNSQQIKLADWYKRSWYQRFIGRILLYVKYWI